jgi:hypothetical protein
MFIIGVVDVSVFPLVKVMLTVKLISVADSSALSVKRSSTQGDAKGFMANQLAIVMVSTP